MIEPKSLAGILLREHDNIQQALRYAERKAKFLSLSNNHVSLDYAEAAEQLRFAIKHGKPLWAALLDK